MNRPPISHIVQQAADECASPDPRVVADAAIAALPKSRHTEALHECMWLYVRSLSSLDQRLRATDSPSVEGRPHAEASADVARMGATRTLAWLHKPVSVAPGVYKFLGDATADDLDIMAQVRREHAKANAAAADKYERLADLMRKAKAARLADLPTDVLEGES